VRLSGLGRGEGTVGVVRAWSPVAGPAGGVVMAGVLAHHLLMAERTRGPHYNALMLKIVPIYTRSCVLR
jgi:hypothetical protein